MNKKASVLVVIAIVAIVGIALWQSQTIRDPSIKVTENETVSVNQHLKEVLTSTSTPSSAAANKSEGTLTEADVRDINEANDQSIGSPVHSESDYSTYDEATLKQMADAGDVAAMKALWVKYLKNDDANDVEQMNKLVTTAIVHGDRDMFKFMPELSSLTNEFTNPEASIEDKRNAMLDILAYHEFMGLRGYTMDKYHGQENFFAIHSTPQAPIKLTAADKSEVLTRAKEIYAAYEAERIKLGLGPFDNSVSDGQKKMFEMQRESYLQAMGENAI